MAVRRSYTAIVERDVLWEGEFASEPYEAAWASEAIFFVRALNALAITTGDGGLETGTARVQLSADGIHWVDEGTEIDLPVSRDEVTFCRVRHFGGWLRITGNVPSPAEIRVLVSLALKE